MKADFVSSLIKYKKICPKAKGKMSTVDRHKQANSMKYMNQNIELLIPKLYPMISYSQVKDAFYQNCNIYYKN